MDSKHRIKKVIWAINPFDQLNTQQDLAALLSQVAKTNDASIEPVFVASGPESEIKNVVYEKYLADVKKWLESLQESEPIGNLAEPKILMRPVVSTKQAVKVLDDYCREVAGDFIAIGTHGRTGLPRYFLGSFAESLLLHTQNPVLSVGPRFDHAGSLEHILYATDFDSNSEEVFEKLLSFARAFNSRITIYHAIRPPVDSSIYYGATGLATAWYLAKDYYDNAEESLAEEGQALLATAKSYGVHAQLIFDKGTGNIADSVIEYAKLNNIGLLAASTQSSGAEAAILGSVARQLVRKSPCPVWIMRFRKIIR